MADTSAVIELKKVVQRFVFKYKLPDEDFINYFEHAADCIRDLSLHAIRSYRDEPATVNALGVLTMPGDMEDLIGVALPYKGEMWYFTEKMYMIIPVTGDESKPTDFQPTWGSYGVTGGANLFYFRVDWGARLIYIDGAESQTVRLQYVSSGLDLLAPTTVPAIATSTIDSYLRWAQGEIDGKSINEQLKRRRTYEEQFRLLKLQALPSARELRDTFLSVTTQAVQR